jgi:uncharacterized protein (TIGR02145 family)
MPLNFRITDVVSHATPNTGTLQVNPDNLGDMPLMLTTSLTLSLPPDPGKAPLPIHVSLDGNGEIYVSKGGQALSNSLSLNIKNTGEGPLYSGDTPRPGQPRVIVSFVYGTTAGSLAPDTDRSQGAVGSAWSIAATPAVTEGNAWRTINPGNIAGLKHPVWVLEPATNNTEVIGGRGKSNVTFSFDKIVSFTPEGHTEMVVQFTGFSQTKDKQYEDKVFVLDISKKSPPEPGVKYFFCPLTVIPANGPDDSIQFPLTWVMSSVARVKLEWTGGVLLEKPYTNRPPLDRDSFTVSLPYKEILDVLGRNRVTTVKFTLHAYDVDGKLLNNLTADPQVRGMWRALSFTSTVTSFTVDDPARVLEVPFHWDMFDVERIRLECGMQGVPAYEKKYDPPQLKSSDQHIMKLGPAMLGQALDSPYPNDVVFTLTAAEGALTLNSLTHRISIVSRYFEDPRDHQKYPVVEIENPRTHRKYLWMARNLNFNAGDASSYYNNDPHFAAQYGRIYTPYGAHNTGVPLPWRVPTRQDWLELLQVYGPDAARAYAAVIAGGSSGLNLQLGGTKSGWGFSGMGTAGYYFGPWIAEGIELKSGSFAYLLGIVTAQASVRYVRDL